MRYLDDGLGPRRDSAVRPVPAIPGSPQGIGERTNTPRASVVVDKSLAEVRGGFSLKDPKSSAGDRVAIFDATIKQDLNKHLEEWSLPHIAFPGPRGGYLRRSNFTRRVFRPAVIGAGFESPNTFHSLRRTYATSLMEQQIEPRAIADLLGHAQVSTSMDLYASRFSGQTARLAEKLGHRRLRAVT